MCYETTGHNVTVDAASHAPGLDVVFKQVDTRHLVLQEVKIQKPEHGKYLIIIFFLKVQSNNSIFLMY